MNESLAEAWGGFLSWYSWDWFLTLTFRDPVPSFRTHRQFAVFARDVGRAAKASVGWFRGDEYGPATGCLHLHALMLGTGQLYRMEWLQEWNRRAGWARILPFDAAKGAAYYCSKYVTKQFGDWQLSDDLRAFWGPQAPVQQRLCAPPTLLTAHTMQLRWQNGFRSHPRFHNDAEDRLIARIDSAAVEKRRS